MADNMVVISWAFAPPATNGGQKRLQGLVEAISGAGWTVHLLLLGSGDFKPGSPGFEAWRKLGVASVHARAFNRIDHYLGLLSRLFEKSYPWSPLTCSPLLRRWVRRQLVGIKPHIVLTNFIEWCPLLRLAKGSRLGFDCVDLWSRHQAQVAMIAKRFPPGEWPLPAPEDHVLLESCCENIGQIDLSAEMQLLARHDIILAISQDEAGEIIRSVSGPVVETVPMCANAVNIGNTYQGPPLMVGHNHPFNAQAYAYFVQRVLPLMDDAGRGFSFRLVGRGAERFPPHPAADIAGFVEDIVEEYRQAAFLMVPVLAGTGQMTRVVEAMGYGLPVVATGAAARSSPIKHGVNGFIAKDAKSFARHVNQLDSDRRLAQAMGRAARDTVASECSSLHMRQRISAIFKKN
jgi:glycosyltransferase involved in cell wall biosynthesis